MNLKLARLPIPPHPRGVSNDETNQEWWVRVGAKQRSTEVVDTPR
jgi:hypothetical protein